MKTHNKITNLDYLTELSKGNKQFVLDMIEIFLAENPEEVKNLDDAIKQRDYPSIRATAHKMKSTIPFVGVDKIIGTEVSEIEKLGAENGDIQKIELLFSTVKEISAKAAEELRS